MKDNENFTKQDSGLPSRPLIGSTAVEDNAERETETTATVKKERPINRAGSCLQCRGKYWCSECNYSPQ